MPDNNKDALCGTLLHGRYRLESVQGTGGFSIIYRAADLETGRPAAVKKFEPDHMEGATPEQKDLGRAQMRREAEMLDRLSDVPGVPGLLDTFQEAGTFWVVKDYLDGMTCEEHARRFRGRIPYALAAYVLRETALILDRVHKKGILHGDVSPMNIFLGADGRVFLIDWGNADYLTVPDDTGTFFHTADNMPQAVNQDFCAPEQLVVQATLDRRTDLYCLAGAIYCAVTGQYPRSAAERLRGQALVPPSAMVSGMPPFFTQMLTDGLSIAKTDRFQSGADIAAEIDRQMTFSVSATSAGLAAVSARLLHEKRSPLGVLISRLRR